jgi:hypothetical protein
MKPELKELLKPPFVYGDGYKYDWDTYHIRVEMDDGETSILKVMPIADRGYYERKFGEGGYVEFVKELTEFTTAALNEKWERDYGDKKNNEYNTDWERMEKIIRENNEKSGTLSEEEIDALLKGIDTSRITGD